MNSTWLIHDDSCGREVHVELCVLDQPGLHSRVLLVRATIVADHMNSEVLGHSR